MRMRCAGWPIFGLAAILNLASAVAEETSPKVSADCVRKARQEYSAQDGERLNRFFQRAFPVETMENVIARRRLEENYCNRYVQCVGISDEMKGMDFSDCIEEESKAHQGESTSLRSAVPKRPAQ